MICHFALHHAKQAETLFYKSIIARPSPMTTTAATGNRILPKKACNLRPAVVPHGTALPGAVTRTIGGRRPIAG